MAEMDELRRRAVRAVGRFFASADGRRLMRHNDYSSDFMIIPAHESERAADVFSRLSDAGLDRALVAVWFPERTDSIGCLELKRSVTPPRGESIDLTKSDSTIGMALDAADMNASAESAAIRAINEKLASRHLVETGFEARIYA